MSAHTHAQHTQPAVERARASIQHYMWMQFQVAGGIQFGGHTHAAVVPCMCAQWRTRRFKTMQCWCCLRMHDVLLPLKVLFKVPTILDKPTEYANSQHLALQVAVPSHRCPLHSRLCLLCVCVHHGCVCTWCATNGVHWRATL